MNLHRHHQRLPMTVVAAAALLSGCAQLMPDPQHQIEASEQVSRVDRHSSFPSIRRVYFEQVNLVEMIDPGRRAEHAYPPAWDATDKMAQEQKWGVRYDLVLGWFRATTEITSEQKRLHRNSVQDKILAVSTSRCNVFKTFLRRQQSDVNFLLGSATTAAGVLGAVLPGVNASRNLAGTAGLFSGLQAEYNTAYYNNLTAHVIVQGIEVRQARLQRDLIQARQGKTLDEYSMEAAINDAIYMDGTCSTVVGLLEAADSIKEVTNPGLARAAEVIAAVRAAGEIAAAEKVSDLADSGKLGKLLKQATTSASPLVVAAVRPEASAAALQRNALADASRGRQQIAAALDQVGHRLADRFVRAQGQLVAAEQASDLKGADVRALFVSAVNAAFVDKLPLTACAEALRAPAQRLGSAELAVQLEAKDEAARIQAEQALLTARADAKAAVQRMQSLVAAAADAADLSAREWGPSLDKPGLSKATLAAPTITEPTDALRTICPAAS